MRKLNYRVTIQRKEDKITANYVLDCVHKTLSAFQ